MIVSSCQILIHEYDGHAPLDELAECCLLVDSSMAHEMNGDDYEQACFLLARCFCVMKHASHIRGPSFLPYTYAKAVQVCHFWHALRLIASLAL